MFALVLVIIASAHLYRYYLELTHFRGEVTGVRDGYTIEIGDQVVRLHGVVVPGIDEAGGKEAAKFLSDIAFSANVLCDPTDEFIGHIPVAECDREGRDLSAMLLNHGYAVICPKTAEEHYHRTAIGAARSKAVYESTPSESGIDLWGFEPPKHCRTDSQKRLLSEGFSPMTKVEIVNSNLFRSSGTGHPPYELLTIGQTTFEADDISSWTWVYVEPNETCLVDDDHSEIRCIEWYNSGPAVALILDEQIFDID